MEELLRETRVGDDEYQSLEECLRYLKQVLDELPDQEVVCGLSLTVSLSLS